MIWIIGYVVGFFAMATIALVVFRYQRVELDKKVKEVWFSALIWPVMLPLILSIALIFGINHFVIQFVSPPRKKK